jgi:hypothetical protein
VTCVTKDGYFETFQKCEQMHICEKLSSAAISNLFVTIKPLKAELHPICHFPALLGTHQIFQVSRIRVKRRRRNCF